jgi:hypothetical protein
MAAPFVAARRQWHKREVFRRICLTADLCEETRGCFTPMNLYSFPEPLEARIAPAAVFTYTDIDGDDVTIKTSKGTNADLQAMGVLFFSDVDPTHPRQLQTIDLSSNAVFAGTSLSVMAKRSATNGGDGRVNVGYIDAFGPAGVDLDLGTVVIDGDLGRINCGTATGVALKKLDVVSMGLFGLTTQNPGNNSAISNIDGRIGSLIIRTDLIATDINTAQIASITIGGSLIGDVNSGHIKASGSIGPIKIGRDVHGGFTDLAGSVTSDGSIKSIFVGGTVFGGDTGNITGSFIAQGDIGSVTIRGDLRGDEEVIFGGTYSGAISAGGNMGAVRILGDIVGSSLAGAVSDNSMDYSGAIRAVGSIKSIFIGGSLRGGGDFSTLGSVMLSGAIASGKNIGSITILGSFVGLENNGNRPGIFARVADAPVNGKLAGIGKIVIKGNVENVDIRAGFAFPGLGGGNNLDAQITTVQVGGNWIGSSVTAGLAMLGSDNFALNSRIGPITIGGAVRGDNTGGTSFVFSAEELVSIRIGGQAIPLMKGKRNDLNPIPVGVSADVRAVELM